MGIGVAGNAGTRKQVHHAVVHGKTLIRGSQIDQRAEAVARPVEYFTRVLDFGKRRQHGGERLVGILGVEHALAEEDLAQRQQRLQTASGVRLKHLIANARDRLRGVDELEDGGVARLGRLGNQGELRAEIAPGSRQALDGRGFENLRPAAIDVRHRHEDFQGFVLNRLARQPEEGFEHVVRLLPTGCRL